MTTETATRTSYSRLSTWLRCPRKFQFRYVEEVPEEVTPVSLLFGVAIHEAVELFLAGLKDGNPPLPDEVHGAFDRAFNDGVALATEMNTPMDWGGNTQPRCSKRARPCWPRSWPKSIAASVWSAPR